MEASIRSIPGIGELAIYDIADRIAGYRGVRPVKVFVYAGTRKGVLAVGLDGTRKTLPLACFPGALSSVEADEAENILRMYRADLERIRLGIAGAPSRRSAYGITEDRNARRTSARRCF
jgi:hypothetical protein